MDYHSDRFQDFSLLIYNSKQLVGILPANRSNKVVYSHQGLTYGGLIVESGTNDLALKAIFENLIDFLKAQGIESLELKVLPEFYQKKPSKTFLSYLDKGQNTNHSTDRVFAIDYRKPLNIHKTKLKHFRKNKASNFEIKEEEDLTAFWNKVLIPRLKEKHKATPVHSLEEIIALKLKFPANIRQFNIYKGTTILAGITIFDKGSIVKSQYGATTSEGEKQRALEFLFLNLIYKFKENNKAFFSMGTVRDITRPKGYNEGLQKQKEELGCKAYRQHFYNIKIS